MKLMAGAGEAPPSSWRTPTPYIFLGLAFVMGVIAVALLVLINARKKAWSSSSDEKAAEAAHALVPLDREPKVVVIMAGDALPSFIAVASAMKPLAFAAPAGAEAV